MVIRPITASEHEAFDAAVSHPLQSYAWGEFRAQTGMQVERVAVFESAKITQAFQITFHPVPHTNFTIGYLPRGSMPDETLFNALIDMGKKRNALFIKMEPNIAAPVDSVHSHKEIVEFLISHGCVPGKPLFTPYTFQLNLTPTEEELLAAMHQKTRYNINLAAKKGVTIAEDSTDQGLEEYLTLLDHTTKRQGFYAHNAAYFRNMWTAMRGAGIAHIFKAVYEGKTLSVWIIFIFNGVLYYPYGASSREHREVMANNLLAWEVIKFGKAHGCKMFDMWGSLGPNPNPSDPWYGFHRFKEGYGGVLSQFIGTYDLVINPSLYGIFQKLDSLRWRLLRLKSKFGL